MNHHAYGVHRLSVGFLLMLSVIPGPAHGDNLKSVLDSILQAPALQGGITGAVVERVRDGRVLYTHDPDIRLMPASNRKLFTSAAGLELLGPDFTTNTDILAAGRPAADGTLTGDLVIKGGGDSTLLSADLDSLAAQVALSGVRTVTGNIVGDGTLFTDGPYGLGWEWDDLSDSEFAQISALELDDGDVNVNVTGGVTAGSTVTVSLDPETDYLPVAVDTAVTGPGTLAVERSWDSNDLIVSGAVAPKTVESEAVPVMNPPLYVATVFQGDLMRHGVSVLGVPKAGSTPAEFTTLIARHVSPPISVYIAKMNKPSDNLLAETLVRLVGAYRGKGGDFADGDALEITFFAKLGLPVAELQLVDGCGVGRRNMVTARSVADLLVGMHAQPNWSAYYSSLPIAGVDGTLSGRMAGTRAAGNVHAKTGTLNLVRCLSGYVTARDGTLYVFSLLMNNFPGTARQAGAVQDRFVEYLADSL